MAAPNYTDDIDVGSLSTYQLPFSSRNRIEGRQNSLEFDHSLKAQTFDPLWFLTRQWQFGELKAENAGSPIMSTACIEEKRMTHVRSRENNGTWDQLSADDSFPPLEVYIESLPMKFTIGQQASMGRKFLKMALQKAGIVDEDVDENLLISEVLDDESNICSFELPEDIDNLSGQTELKEKWINSDPRSIQMLKALAGKVPNGYKIYRDSLIASSIDRTIDGYLITAGFSIGDAADLVLSFKDWIEETFQIDPVSMWNEAKMNYESAIGFRISPTNSDEYKINDYSSENLDWHSFDISTAPSTVSGIGDSSYLTKRKVTSIPTPARFYGMPASRWWEMEDKSIDYANLNAESNEIVKLAITEFALVYSNDWFTIPIQVNTGAITNVKAIVVTDVFGEKTLINKASHEGTRTTDGTPEHPDNPWNGWKLFKNDTNEYYPNVNEGSATDALESYSDSSIFLPDVLPFVQKSEPIEQVNFIRDEIDNRVWAIEHKIFNEVLGSIDGNIASNNTVKYLKKQLNVSDDSGFREIALSYILQNEVPENWIPFVPKLFATGERDFQLIRGHLLRNYTSPPSSIRPRTEILSKGVNPSTLVVDEQLLMHIEEVPKAGLIVEEKNQRTRWYNGQTFIWLGRNKRIGRLVTNSPLAFDNLELNKASLENTQLAVKSAFHPVSSPNVLEVKFSKPVTLKNTNGFTLNSGTEITGIHSGNGSSKISFSLNSSLTAATTNTLIIDKQYVKTDSVDIEVEVETQNDPPFDPSVIWKQLVNTKGIAGGGLVLHNSPNGSLWKNGALSSKAFSADNSITTNIINETTTVGLGVTTQSIDIAANGYDDMGLFVECNSSTRKISIYEAGVLKKNYNHPRIISNLTIAFASARINMLVNNKLIYASKLVMNAPITPVGLLYNPVLGSPEENLNSLLKNAIFENSNLIKSLL